MRRILTWFTANQYQWYRKEYLNVFKICLFSLIPLAIGGIIVGVGLVRGDIGLLVWGIALAECAVMFTIRFVDEHEKKIQKASPTKLIEEGRGRT